MVAWALGMCVKDRLSNSYTFFREKFHGNKQANLLKSRALFFDSSNAATGAISKRKNK
jgi:hypothetical protein